MFKPIWKIFAAAALAGSLAISLTCSELPESKGPVRFLALSDTHIATDRELAVFRDFLYTVGTRNVEFVLVLGDLVGHAPEYLEPIKEIASSAPLPVYFLPGNHDDNYTWDSQWWSSVFGRMYYGFEHRGIHFIMNWSQDMYAPLPWLDRYLGSIPRGKPIVFCQHFPPRFSGAPETGPWPLLAGRAGDVVLALSGHTHTRGSAAVGAIRSETLGDCFMDTTADGHFYEITLSEDKSGITIEELSFRDLELASPEDNPPVVTLDYPGDYFVLDDSVRVWGTSRDDQGVATVQWRVDDSFWRTARGAGEWELKLKEKLYAPGHHMLWVRSRDNTGQASLGFARATFYIPEPEPESNSVVLRQGLDNYEGCRDVTVRGHRPRDRTDTEDLECWIYGKDASREFSEFYIAFDLAGLGIKPGARVSSVKLVLFCCRQNSLSPLPGDDLYRVGLAGEPWKESMCYTERPRVPAWHPAQKSLKPLPCPSEWVVPDGRQELRPEKPVTVDLSSFAGTVERWLKSNSGNYGWVISPVKDEYNISFRSSEYGIPTLRPRLVITFDRDL